MESADTEAKRLRDDVEWALRSALDAGEVLPLLHRLARTAPPGSDECVYAHRHLAELLVERNPWRAALHARRVLATAQEDDRAWAVLGLCQTLLGNYKYAASAYFRALHAAPKNPWYAHNLGHLIDVALGRADEAVTWLRTAYEGAMGNREIASSFAHALARTGRLAEARRVLSRAMKKGVSREQAALWRWLEDGAPPEGDTLPRSMFPGPGRTAAGLSVRSDDELALHERVGGDPLDDLHDDALDSDEKSDLDAAAAAASSDGGPAATESAKKTRRPRRRDRAAEASSSPAGAPAAGARAAEPAAHAPKHPPAETLEDALLRGLEHLPLDGRQRARARALAREPAVLSLAEATPALASLAAAVAYAIVYVDQVPLTQAEVAATYRVSVASLRGRFTALRTRRLVRPRGASLSP